MEQFRTLDSELCLPFSVGAVLVSFIIHDLLNNRLDANNQNVFFYTTLILGDTHGNDSPASICSLARTSIF